MKTRTIRQTIAIHASAHDVYEMLMDERKHALFTGGGTQGERLIPTTGIQPARTWSWYRTKKLSRPGGQVTGPMTIIQR